MTITITKPWGYELLFTPGNNIYTGKIIHINKGHKLSRQYHMKKDETFLVQSGEMDLEIGGTREIGDGPIKPDKIIRMKPGDSYHCKPGTFHRMVAISDCSVIEVSSPEVDDIVRLEDAYGREGTNKP